MYYYLLNVNITDIKTYLVHAYNNFMWSDIVEASNLTLGGFQVVGLDRCLDLLLEAHVSIVKPFLDKLLLVEYAIKLGRLDRICPQGRLRW